jgi:hypothetical protein
MVLLSKKFYVVGVGGYTDFLESSDIYTLRDR